MLKTISEKPNNRRKGQLSAVTESPWENDLSKDQNYTIIQEIKRMKLFKN